MVWLREGRFLKIFDFRMSGESLEFKWIHCFLMQIIWILVVQIKCGKPSLGVTIAPGYLCFCYFNNVHIQTNLNLILNIINHNTWFSLTQLELPKKTNESCTPSVAVCLVLCLRNVHLVQCRMSRCAYHLSCLQYWSSKTEGDLKKPLPDFSNFFQNIY